MKTLEAIDFRGEPFINITFTAPSPIDDIWEFAATLTGDEWSYDDFETPWTTTLTGATTVRDVLVTSSEGFTHVLQLFRGLREDVLVGTLRCDDSTQRAQP